MTNRPLSHYSPRSDSIRLATRRRHCERNSSNGLRMASIATPPMMMTTLCQKSSPSQWCSYAIISGRSCRPSSGTTITPPLMKIGRRQETTASMAAAAASDAVATDSSESLSSPQKGGGEAVVVGAGPAGLAASIMLAKLGWERVVVRLLSLPLSQLSVIIIASSPAKQADDVYLDFDVHDGNVSLSSLYYLAEGLER